MAQIRIAVAQVNTTVGDLAGNVAKIALWAHEASNTGAAIIVFPELALSGYPPEDLVLKNHFMVDCERHLTALAAELPGKPIVIIGSPTMAESRVRNSALVFRGGQQLGAYDKMLLPNYGVFDEHRIFEAGEKGLVIQSGDARIGLHICEDSWSTEEPSCALLRPLELDVVLNLSASPYHRGKVDARQTVLKKAAAAMKTNMIYCNLVGGQDELVFDGASMAMSKDGHLLARAKQFEEDLMVLDIGIASKRNAMEEGPAKRVDVLSLDDVSTAKAEQSLTVEPMPRDPADVYSALKLGLYDYVNKNGFERVLVALSGGIDSAIVGAIAVDALGADRVKGVTMPSQYTSDETLQDAHGIAKNMGVEIFDIPIRGLYDAYIQELAPHWEGRDEDTTEENLQARIRGNIAMALSNKFGWLVLATGNKSEMAVGYCTLYGDMVGGFSVLKDVPKTLVYELAHWRNAQSDEPVIPPSTIERPPSAELRDDQKDTDSLPPYDILDAILEDYVEGDLGSSQIAEKGFDPETVARVIRLVDLNEYKRRQGAPGIKITPKAFGRDRRLPITNLYRAEARNLGSE